MQNENTIVRIEQPSFLRLPEVLKAIPVSKSTWWAGVRDGRFPKPVKLSERCTAWRAADIKKLIESFDDDHAGEPPSPTSDQHQGANNA